MKPVLTVQFSRDTPQEALEKAVETIRQLEKKFTIVVKVEEDYTRSSGDVKGSFSVPFTSVS